MSNLPAYYGALGELVVPRGGRHAARQAALARAQREALSAAGLGAVDGACQITEAALLATAHISAVEALLISRSPHAEARLRFVADAGCTSLANIVLRAGGGW
jgi:hypothetical protein